MPAMTLARRRSVISDALDALPSTTVTLDPSLRVSILEGPVPPHSHHVSLQTGDGISRAMSLPATFEVMQTKDSASKMPPPSPTVSNRRIRRAFIAAKLDQALCSPVIPPGGSAEEAFEHLVSQAAVRMATRFDDTYLDRPACHATSRGRSRVSTIW
jgi:hypothetical protein